MTDIRVITTGGTIDKIYFDRLSDFQVGDPQIGELLTEANVTFTWAVTALMRKDSLDLDDEDRERIVAAVRACEEQCILVTHGTDTMVATAQRLQAAELGRTIVLTGAMQPATQRDSDAVFNIGFAIGVLRSRAPGVYVAMNGQAFTPELARKNREQNRFEPL
ncbi:MAG TPA: asparaginase domain-containing protein [Pseudomonadales bacterium]|nr:asparaginase domain-containing protein [Pseudomonadales bacterium]